MKIPPAVRNEMMAAARTNLSSARTAILADSMPGPAMRAMQHDATRGFALIGDLYSPHFAESATTRVIEVWNNNRSISEVLDDVDIALAMLKADAPGNTPARLPRTTVAPGASGIHSNTGLLFGTDSVGTVRP